MKQRPRFGYGQDINPVPLQIQGKSRPYPAPWWSCFQKNRAQGKTYAGSWGLYGYREEIVANGSGCNVRLICVRFGCFAQTIADPGLFGGSIIYQGHLFSKKDTYGKAVNV